jgi:hypothetical protein
MLKRALIGSVAAVTLATGGTLAYSATAQATTQHQPSARTQLHRLERAIVDRETFTIDGRTYLAVRMPDRWTPADARLCAEFSLPADPTTGEWRELAYDATYANGWLKRDTETLVTYGFAGRAWSGLYLQVQRDCGEN